MDAAQIATMIADREAGTPGPWKVDGPVWNQIVWTDNENRLCFMAHSNGLNDGRDEANARRIARVPDMESTIIAQAAELERLREALTGCISALEHADLSDGVCCCGDEMATHPEPMNCGHSPVDAGEYYSMGIIKQAHEALKGGTQ